MKTTSSPGFDGITVSMIRHAHKACPDMILKVFQKCFDDAIVPNNWKHAVVAALPKSGKSQNTTKGWRPISLLPVMEKIFEGVILKRMTAQITPTSNHQHGFRKGKSSITAIEEVIGHIKRTHNTIPIANKTILRNRLSIVMVTLDISGTFDNVKWSRVIEELTKRQVDSRVETFPMSSNFLSHCFSIH